MIIRILDEYLQSHDIITNYIYFECSELAFDFGKFEIQINFTEDKKYLVNNKRRLYYVLFKEKYFGFITSCCKDVDENGDEYIKISGRMENFLFARRIVNGTFKFHGKPYKFIEELIKDQIVESRKPIGNKTERYMKIEVIISPEDKAEFEKEPIINKEVTGGYIWDAIIPLMTQYNIGIMLHPVVVKSFFKSEEEMGNVSGWKLQFYAGKDKRIGKPEGVVYSQSLSNMIGVDYTRDLTNYKTVAYIAGEGEGESRKWYKYNKVKPTTISAKGINRAELWIDARDIQSEVNGLILPEQKYEELIRKRAEEKLAENDITEKYELVRTGVNDYKDVGYCDLVTVLDKQLDMTLEARVLGKTISAFQEDTEIVESLIISSCFVPEKSVSEEVSSLKQTIETNRVNVVCLESKMEKQKADITSWLEGKNKIGTFEGKDLYRIVVRATGDFSINGAKDITVPIGEKMELLSFSALMYNRGGLNVSGASYPLPWCSKDGYIHTFIDRIYLKENKIRFLNDGTKWPNYELIIMAYGYEREVL